MQRVLPFCFLVMLSACKTPAPATSAVRTDETQGVLRDICRRYEPEGNLAELRTELCSCLASKRAAGETSIPADTCATGGGLDQWTDHIRRTAAAAGVSALTNTAGDEMGADDRACLANLVDFNLEIRLGYLQSACERDKLRGKIARDMFTFPGRPDPNQCWRLTRMDAAACMVAEPCDPTKPTDLKGLPVDNDDLAAYRTQYGSTFVPAGQSVSLCHARIQAIHRLKDPDDAERPYNLAFANLLGFGQSAPRQSFQASNCHGTAQAVAGGFLDALPVSDVVFNGPYVERDCKDVVAPVVEAARTKAAAAGRGTIAGDFPIADGGHVINMTHDATCDASELGAPKLYVSGCENGRIKAHIQYYGMCINKWTQLLADAGRQVLPEDAAWSDLKPGCVMTANDHRISLVAINDLWCYYYEATTPFGPPLLRVESCPMLFTRFERRYCPSAPMEFSLRAAD